RLHEYHSTKNEICRCLPDVFFKRIAILPFPRRIASSQPWNFCQRKNSFSLQFQNQLQLTSRRLVSGIGHQGEAELLRRLAVFPHLKKYLAAALVQRSEERRVGKECRAG